MYTSVLMDENKRIFWLWLAVCWCLVNVTLNLPRKPLEGLMATNDNSGPMDTTQSVFSDVSFGKLRHKTLMVVKILYLLSSVWNISIMNSLNIFIGKRIIIIINAK
jgi:hypothetical protein